MGWLSHERYEAEFAGETERLSAVVAGLEPADPIPTCPEWTVRDLVAHVGRGHRWSASMIEERSSAPILPLPEPHAPDDRAEWSEWLISGALRLADAVRDAGPDTEVWTWQPDRTAGFWLRRMLHDELIHRYDAEVAAGTPGDIAADLAADGVSDFLDSVATLSRTDHAFAALRGEGETLRFETPEGAWFVERTPAGVLWRHGDDAADVVVHGRSQDVLLVLNRRLAPASVSASGDAALFSQWLESGTF